MRQPTLAEMIASILRSRILDGELADGDTLPRQEDLLEEFGVSRPPLREALRILEAEGLITVRRGNMGGAVVHRPTADNAAYMIALVLRFRGANLSDLSNALRRIEPVCASLCASRPDRVSEVVAPLRAIHERVIEAVDDEDGFVVLSRLFHEQLVVLCGNETLVLVVGALESLWSQQEQEWAMRASAAGEFPELENRLSGIRAHERILQLIEAGDSERVASVTQRHLDISQRYTLSDHSDRTVISLPTLNGK